MSPPLYQAVIDPGGVPREQNILKGHLPRVMYQGTPTQSHVTSRLLYQEWTCGLDRFWSAAPFEGSLSRLITNVPGHYLCHPTGLVVAMIAEFWQNGDFVLQNVSIK